VETVPKKLKHIDTEEPQVSEYDETCGSVRLDDLFIPVALNGSFSLLRRQLISVGNCTDCIRECCSQHTAGTNCLFLCMEMAE